jgi:hypothetical protein
MCELSWVLRLDERFRGGEHLGLFERHVDTLVVGWDLLTGWNWYSLLLR